MGHICRSSQAWTEQWDQSRSEQQRVFKAALGSTVNLRLSLVTGCEVSWRLAWAPQWFKGHSWLHSDLNVKLRNTVSSRMARATQWIHGLCGLQNELKAILAHARISSSACTHTVSLRLPWATPWVQGHPRQHCEFKANSGYRVWCVIGQSGLHSEFKTSLGQMWVQVPWVCTVILRLGCVHSEFNFDGMPSEFFASQGSTLSSYHSAHHSESKADLNHPESLWPSLAIQHVPDYHAQPNRDFKVGPVDTVHSSHSWAAQ
jgi:hypothetical protein